MQAQAQVSLRALCSLSSRSRATTKTARACQLAPSIAMVLEIEKATQLQDEIIQAGYG